MTTPHVPALDGFRAYAILGVLALHCLGLSGVSVIEHSEAFQTVVWGTVGNAIDVFFVISGFVIFLPVVVRGGALGSVAPKHLKLEGLKWRVAWASSERAEKELNAARGYLYAIVPDFFTNDDGAREEGFYIITYELPPAPTLGEVIAKASKDPAP